MGPLSRRAAFLAVATLCIAATPLFAQSVLDAGGIAQSLGRAGSAMPGDVYRVAFPRSDLKVTIDGVVVAPGLGLGGYAAFKQEPDTTMVVGDVVLREDEIQNVITSLENGGFHITALHNHLRNETPHVMYLHFMGTGEAKLLATSLRSALLLTKTPLGATKKADATTTWFAKTIQDGVGYQGKVANGILSIGVPRAESITMQGYPIPPAMGVGIVMNFQGVGAARVATTGDFVLIASEVNGVEQSLKSHGFEVTALHHHMIGDSPPLYYMHFWSVQPPSEIAAGLKDALAHVNKRPL